MTKVYRPNSFCRLRIKKEIDKAQLAADELRGEFLHGRFHDSIQIVFLKHIVRAVGIEPQKGQHHLHILLNTTKVVCQPSGERRVLVLQGQPHGRNGRFDLVRPYGIVVDHIRILIAGFGFILAMLSNSSYGRISNRDKSFLNVS